ncbi:RNA-directed DNA polymerase, eukaryota, reverse transcriptase zinc-binding domain protein [Tanacetum coccineum]
MALLTSRSLIFYADDLIITTEWNPGDSDNIIRVLYVFYLASGLKININKSNIYGIGVSDDEVSNMARNSRCAVGSFPFTYLGLPIGSNMVHISSCKTLTDRFQLRISSWKVSLLSIGGRLTFIKAVLGGLNIGSLKSFNLALLQKCHWRWFSFPNALWVKVIKAIHGYVVPTGRVKVPTGRVKVPAGRYVVPTGKDNVIVSADRAKVIPAGRTILVLVVLCLLRVDSIVS